LENQEFLGQKVIWIVYYLISVVLALMMVRSTEDKAYQMIGLTLMASFGLLVATYGGVSLREYSLIAMTIGYVLFLRKIIKSKELKTFVRVFLITLPTTTVLNLFSRVLQQPYGTELKLISIFIFTTALIYSLVRIYITKSFNTTSEPLEINGLFAAILLPMLIH
jgi:hypothetical protein